MEYGILLNSVAPVRSEAREQSEMVSQLLFGETFSWEEPEKNNFYRITNQADGYSGWISKKMVTIITKEIFNELNTQESYRVVVPIADAFDLSSKCIIRIPGGSRLPFCDDIGRFGINNKKFQIHRDFLLPENELLREGLMETALSFMNAPYLWGGKNILGMDCSGFTQTVFCLHGLQLMRDAKDQAKQGVSVSLPDARTGDLLFFDNAQGAITHVGIYLNDNKIIHCSGSVKIDKIDEKGIYSEEEMAYTHRFCLGRRV